MKVIAYKQQYCKLEGLLMLDKVEKIVPNVNSDGAHWIDIITVSSKIYLGYETEEERNLDYDNIIKFLSDDIVGNILHLKGKKYGLL